MNLGDGTFTDVTESFCPNLLNPGLLSDAKLVHLNGDDWVDLVITGEWMAPQVYLNQSGNSLALKADAFPSGSSGWWKHITVADLDSDGDLDLVMGNQGDNNPYKTSMDQPMRLISKDFDGNGSIDPIFTHYMADTNAFAFSRDELVGQLPMFRGKFADYRSFAKTPIEQFFTSEQIAGADTLTAMTLKSGYFLNDGNANFSFKPLPQEAQFSPIYATAVHDVNGDGYPDLLTGGNLKKTRVSSGQQDANYGFVFLGDGKGNFVTKSPLSSGLMIRGDVRDIQMISVRGKTYAIYALNNGRLRVYALNS